MKGKIKLTLIFIMVVIILIVVLVDKYKCLKDHKAGNTIADLKKQFEEFKGGVVQYEIPEQGA